MGAARPALNPGGSLRPIRGPRGRWALGHGLPGPPLKPPLGACRDCLHPIDDGRNRQSLPSVTTHM